MLKNAFEWKRVYELGLEEIDSQHKYFLVLIQLFSRTASEEANPKAIAILDELLRYTRIHIIHEKAMLEEYGYSERHEHYKEHGELMSKLIHLKEDFLAGKINRSKIVIFLLEWFVEHTTIADRGVVNFLIAERNDLLNFLKED